MFSVYLEGVKKKDLCDKFIIFFSNILERKKKNINVVDPAKTELEKSIGGSASIGNNTPVCGGRYEVDDGIKVNKQSYMV